MFAHQVCSSLSHFINIKPVPGKVRIEPPHGIRHLRVPDAVFIGLDRAAPARVKIRRNLHGGLDADLVRKANVYCMGKFFRGNAALRIEYSEIAAGVHPRVRPAGPDDLHWYSGKLSQGAVQFSLDRGNTALLRLETGVIRAVIGDGKKNSFTHNAITSSAKWSSYFRIIPDCTVCAEWIFADKAEERMTIMNLRSMSINL